MPANFHHYADDFLSFLPNIKQQIETQFMILIRQQSICFHMCQPHLTSAFQFHSGITADPVFFCSYCSFHYNILFLIRLQYQKLKRYGMGKENIHIYLNPGIIFTAVICYSRKSF